MLNGFVSEYFKKFNILLSFEKFENHCDKLTWLQMTSTVNHGFVCNDSLICHLCYSVVTDSSFPLRIIILTFMALLSLSAK